MDATPGAIVLAALLAVAIAALAVGALVIVAQRVAWAWARRGRRRVL